jgi:acyl-CoA reductase-like NAD-dependent aldehyde dehydrogenase
VEINGGAFNPLAPFGGYKQSGHGRELGKYGLEEFFQLKALQLPMAPAEPQTQETAGVGGGARP